MIGWSGPSSLKGHTRRVVGWKTRWSASFETHWLLGGVKYLVEYARKARWAGGLRSRRAHQAKDPSLKVISHERSDAIVGKHAVWENAHAQISSEHELLRARGHTSGWEQQNKTENRGITRRHRYPGNQMKRDTFGSQISLGSISFYYSNCLFLWAHW
jgi:hypothetical protein